MRHWPASVDYERAAPVGMTLGEGLTCGLIKEGSAGSRELPKPERLGKQG